MRPGSNQVAFGVPGFHCGCSIWNGGNRNEVWSERDDKGLAGRALGLMLFNPFVSNKAA